MPQNRKKPVQKPAASRALQASDEEGGMHASDSSDTEHGAAKVHRKAGPAPKKADWAFSHYTPKVAIEQGTRKPIWRWGCNYCR